MRTPHEAPDHVRDVRAQLRQADRRWWFIFGLTLGLGFVIAMLDRVTEPQAFPLAFTVLLLCCGAAIVRPAVGVYLIVFLTLIGDLVTTAWWPFTKNMSSRESILFVHDALILSPLELMLFVTTVAFFLQGLEDRSWKFRQGRLFWPIVAFTSFVFFGLVRGYLAGFDQRIAIFESRSLVYILIVYILVTNLIVTRAQYHRLLMCAFVAVAIQSIFSLTYYRGLPEAERLSIESLSEHPATVHMNALFVYGLALALLHCKQATRWAVIVMLPPVVYAYILSQRRAAMIALIIGVAVLCVFVFQRHQRAFWVFTPTALILGAGFVLATWNAEGAVGLPAQAVKTVVAPGELSGADQSSDIYRWIEGYDIWFTIRQDPIAGIGFGRPFSKPFALPDISFFEFWEYIPHNSVLWVWMKMGYLGFVAMLFMIGRAIQLGARSARRVERSDHAADIIAGLSFVIMFIVFAYVDIAWGPRTTVFLAVAFALCGDYEDAPDAEQARERVHFDAHPRERSAVLR